MTTNYDSGLNDHDPQNHLEYRMVRLTLKTFGLQDSEKLLRNLRQNEMGGERTLCFEAFERMFPDFPMVIRSRALRARVNTRGTRTTRPPSISMLVTNFGCSGIAKFYEHLVVNLTPVADGRPIGMVFPFAGVHGGWILHNGTFATKTSPQRITIETDWGSFRFERFVNVLKVLRASHWVPGGTLRPAAPASTAAAELIFYDPGLPVPRYIQRLLKNKTQAAVLALIWQLLTRDLRRAECGGIKRHDDGVRYATVTVQKIGEVIGRSRRCVQQALDALQENGLLVSKRGFQGSGNPSGYRIPQEVLERIAHD